MHLFRAWNYLARSISLSSFEWHLPNSRNVWVGLHKKLISHVSDVSQLVLSNISALHFFTLLLLLEKGYLHPLQSFNDWANIARGFENRWNLPHCVGALIGKHVVVQVPAKSGSLFFNYKKSFRIVLFALCDASYQLTAVDFGEVSTQSDGGVFANSNLGRSIVNDYFDLLHPNKLYSESKFCWGWCFPT